MDKLVYIYYPLLGIFLFCGAKFYGKKNWNDGCMSLSQTKALQGFCAICVMLHHIAQKTCAPWLDAEVIVHGLDVFVPIGYWFVGIFLFCSGYGLYKSYQEKTDYLHGFWGRRFFVPILALVTINFIYIFVRFQLGESVYVSTPYHVTGPQMGNPYAWFVYVLLFFYFGFYLTFKHCKSKLVAILLITLGVILYIAHCDWWMYGTWWYNSILLVIVGLLFARYEQIFIREMKRHYGIYLAMTLVGTLLFFLLGEYTEGITAFLGMTWHYQIGRWVKVLAQMVAAVCFTLTVVLLGLKIRIGNKALTFMGSITLEFYLIHGVVLQIFGYNEAVEGRFYIKNVALLVLVVLGCSLCLSFLLHKFYRLFAGIMRKNKKLSDIICRDVKRLVVGLLVFLVFITVYMSVSARKESLERQEAVAQYEKEHITYAEVDARKMAAYVSGEGRHTVVLLCGLGDYCPTITLKPLADRLAEQNRVVVLDYFGSGFSDDTDKERTADNLVYEIHTALKNLGEAGPYILLAHDASGIYAQLFTAKYPEEVEAVIGVDSTVSEQWEQQLTSAKVTPDEYIRTIKKQSDLQYFGQKFLSASGYTRLQWPAYQSIFEFGHTDDEMLVLQEMFVQNYFSRNVANERANQYDNSQLLIGEKYAEDLPVQLFLSYYGCVSAQNSGVEWVQLHQDLCTNTELQKITVLNGNPYLVYMNPQLVAERSQAFIDGLDLIQE